MFDLTFHYGEGALSCLRGFRFPTPDVDPQNYGGQRLDFLTGVSLAKGCFSIGIEGGIPLYENLNGLQLSTAWMLTVAGQVMF